MIRSDCWLVTSMFISFCNVLFHNIFICICGTAIFYLHLNEQNCTRYLAHVENKYLQHLYLLINSAHIGGLISLLLSVDFFLFPWIGSNTLNNRNMIARFFNNWACTCKLLPENCGVLYSQTDLPNCLKSSMKFSKICSWTQCSSTS